MSSQQDPFLPPLSPSLFSSPPAKKPSRINEEPQSQKQVDTNASQKNQNSQQTPHRKRQAEEQLQKDDFTEEKLFQEQNIQINFDGACRKPDRETKCAIGVYVGNYKSQYNMSSIIEAKTSQQAEIIAATEAIKTIIKIANQFNKTQFTLCGDSGHVIDTITSGRIYNYKTSSKLVNSTIWTKLAAHKKESEDLGIEIKCKWIPRRENAEADELCNAAIEMRKANENIITNKIHDQQEFEQAINEAAQKITTRRRKIIRTIPHELHNAWSTIIHTVTVLNIDQNSKRTLFMILPHVLSAYQSTIKSRTEFKRLRTHLGLLSDKTYMQNVLNDIANEPYTHRQSNKATEAIRIQTLAKRGLYDKIIPKDDTFIYKTTEIEAIKAKLTELFPHRQLPQPLQLPATHHIQIEWGELSESYRTLKRGKASSICGWSKELLAGVFAIENPPGIKHGITEIFNQLANTNITNIEKQLLTQGTLIPLGYNGTTKIRPIIIKEAILKVILITLIRRTTKKDNTLIGYGSSFMKPKGCAIATYTIQQALDEGKSIYCCDAKNAYNTIHREKAFEYIKSKGNIYFDMFPILNLIYANENTCSIYDEQGKNIHTQSITNGTAQGCVTSQLFLQWTMIPILRTFKNLISVVDDLNIIIPETTTTRLSKAKAGTPTQIIEAFKTIGLDLQGPKTRILAKSNTNIQQTYQNIPIISTVAAMHGAFVLIDRNTPTTECIKCLDKMTTKLQKRVNACLNLQTTTQTKFLVCRSFQWYQLYYATAIPQGKQATEIMKYIDKTYTTALIKLIPNLEKTQNHHVLIHTPLEDGGLGFIPYEIIQPQLAQETQSLAQNTLAEVGLKYDITHTGEYNGKSLNYIWKHIASTRGWNKLSSQPHQTHRSWLEHAPTTQLTSLSDETFNAAILHRLKWVNPFTYTCPIKMLNLHTLDGTQFCEHLDTCPHCAAPSYHLRHEAVVQTIGRTFRYNGLTCETNPRDLPLPTKRKGGPDFVIWQDTTWAGDVCITTNRTQTIFNTKMNKYEEFCQATNARCFPFAMTTQGQIDEHTITILNEIAHQHQRKHLTNQILAHATFACLKGQANGILRLKTRHLLHTDMTIEQEEHT